MKSRPNPFIILSLTITTTLPQNQNNNIQTAKTEQMKCISCGSLSSPFLHQTKSPPCILPLKKKNGVALRVIPSQVLLAVTSPAPGKLSVLLQTGAVCLIAFWVANFVVPGFIIKDFQSKKMTDEDGEEDDEQ